jgi:hypothetical protein
MKVDVGATSVVRLDTKDVVGLIVDVEAGAGEVEVVGVC